MRRLTLLAVTGVIAAGAAAPALAESLTAPTSPVPPITVTHSTDGGVFVGTAIGNQPLVGASVANGRACAGFSFEVPFCADLPGVAVTTLPHQVNVGPVQAGYSTSGGVSFYSALGSQPLVGGYESNGTVCVGFSLEVPFCETVSTGAKTLRTGQALPGGGVVIYHDSTRTAVGYNDVGVVIYSDGTICPVVSTQAWKCVPGAGA